MGLRPILRAFSVSRAVKALVGTPNLTFLCYLLFKYNLIRRRLFTLSAVPQLLNALNYPFLVHFMDFEAFAYAGEEGNGELSSEVFAEFIKTG